MSTKLSIESKVALETHSKMMKLHYMALACHCECIGMNAENCIAAGLDQTPPYSNKHYLDVMKKWRLTNEKGEVVI